MTGKLLPLRRIEGRCEELSDEGLVGSCAAGDQAAMGALIDRYQRPVYRFVARLTGSDRDDRADLVQATFVELARSAHRYRGESSVQVWIFGIAANLTRNHIRSSVRRRRMETALAVIPAQRGSRPDEQAQHNELLRRLQDALVELPHPLREVFVLCELESMSAREAATVIGVREGTVWHRLHDARRTLRVAIGGAT